MLSGFWGVIHCWNLQMQVENKLFRMFYKLYQFGGPVGGQAYQRL